jgi:hypothetical protein
MKFNSRGMSNYSLFMLCGLQNPMPSDKYFQADIAGNKKALLCERFFCRYNSMYQIA